MTLLPTDDRDVHGFEGPEYQMSRFCAKPGCDQYGRELHHIWRRSALGGPYNWVVLPDGSAAGNLLRLCREHHRLITENQARISFESGSYYWIEDGAELRPLDFQPPWIVNDVENIEVVLATPTEPHQHRFENGGKKTEPLLDNECPTCHQPLPKPKIKKEKKEAKRLRRSWTITVPVDERENGADTLDELLEGCREDLDLAGISYGPGPKTKFFVAATVFGLFRQHFRELMSDE